MPHVPVKLTPALCGPNGSTLGLVACSSVLLVRFGPWSTLTDLFSATLLSLLPVLSLPPQRLLSAEVVAPLPAMLLLLWA